MRLLLLNGEEGATVSSSALESRVRRAILGAKEEKVKEGATGETRVPFSRASLIGMQTADMVHSGYCKDSELDSLE